MRGLKTCLYNIVLPGAQKSLELRYTLRPLSINFGDKNDDLLQIYLHQMCQAEICDGAVQPHLLRKFDKICIKNVLLNEIFNLYSETFMQSKYQKYCHVGS